MTVAIRHDAFGRYEIVRRTESTLGNLVKDCRNCGNPRVRRNKSLPTLFRYGFQQDGVYTQVAWDDKLFCSIQCRDSYYG